MSARGYLGLGSNIGDRLAHVGAAAATLAEHGIDVRRASSVYETEPVGLVTDQREFYNAALEIETSLGPEELLVTCKGVESAVGREPSGVRHGPRVIDVDVLLLDELDYASERVRLPHPEVLTRRFVLVPLLELDPELRLPSGERLAEALGALGDGQAVRRVAPPPAVGR